MIGVYDYTVLLTYLGFSSGVYGIIEALQGHIFPAIFCLMFAGLCDMFDGKVARTKKQRTIEERHFGIQLDSLSDVVCFGILPACQEGDVMYVIECGTEMAKVTMKGKPPVFDCCPKDHGYWFDANELQEYIKGHMSYVKKPSVELFAEIVKS